MTRVFVSGHFDNLRSRHVRFLDEASRLGLVHVLLWSDALTAQAAGRPPAFPLQERRYLLEAIRYVDRASVLDAPGQIDSLPANLAAPGDVWAVDESADTAAKRVFCADHDLQYHVIGEDALARFPDAPPDEPTPPGMKRVIVTGCYDWFHSGHVRFFEECAALGELYAVVGHDANIELLKGPGHPLFPQAERRYMVAAVRFVHQGLISSGHGWLDAEPEIEQIKPHIYAVNEDGDKPEKRDYCAAHGIEYHVLRRKPKAGLPSRQSTHLRGF